MEAVRVESIRYVYPDGTVGLEEASLTIEEGEFLAFIGQNGSGKTTLAKNIAGLLKPTEGRVLVYGQDTREVPMSKMATLVGYIFQNPDHQLFNQTVYDEIAYGPRNLKLPEDEVEERVREAMEIVGLPESFREGHPFFLTRGLRQRVAIASILAMRPRVIIVDEPTTGQDFRQSIDIMDFLLKLNREHGHTIVIITHDMPIVAKYAQRTVVMAWGRILLDGPTRWVFSQVEVLAEAHIKPPQVTRLAQRLADLGVPPDVLTVEEMVGAVEALLSRSQ
ncbi:MAG: ABC transporter ATP-binding protein [Thermoproteota archaeon]|nr:MAG: ABC transporter ATP-binding protein [Candidatus Korarchaeota archaeon]